LLRLIAGLEEPSDGTIHLDGACINAVPPNHRQMGLVVQNYALFPHMTVFENAAYGLRVRRLSEKEVRRRVRDALALVRLSEFEDRLPRQLSGGQQQRCALARAVVIEPALLLLDEALGALDKKLREEMQVELRHLQRRLGVTTVHVTHDQEEALGMSDRIVVLNEGHVEQIDSPEALYETPETEFVAHFIGEANIFKARIEALEPSGLVSARGPDGERLWAQGASDVAIGDEITFVVRPEYVSLADARPDGQVNAFAGIIDALVYHGNITKIVVRSDEGRSLIVYRPNALDGASERRLQLADRVWVSWPPLAARLIKA